MFSVSVSFNSHVACLGPEIHWDTQLGKRTNSGVPYTLTNSAYNRVSSLDFHGFLSWFKKYDLDFLVLLLRLDFYIFLAQKWRNMMKYMDEFIPLAAVKYSFSFQGVYCILIGVLIKWCILVVPSIEIVVTDIFIFLFSRRTSWIRLWFQQ